MQTEKAALTTKLAEVVRELAEVKSENEGLRAKLRLREAEMFSASTEKDAKQCGDAKRDASPTQGAEAEERSNPPHQDDRDGEGKRKRGGQEGRKGHGRRRYEQLPVEESESDLSENEKRCSECGLPYEQFLETEDSEQIEVDIRIYRHRKKRKRYKRGCQCHGVPAIITAPAPPKLIPKGLLGISVWVYVLLDKFLFQRPTYRLLADLKTHGLDLSQGTVTSGMQRLAPLFDPILEAIHAKNLEEDHWHADETRWLVFVQLDEKESNRWWLWVFRSKSTVEYVLSPWRSAEVPLQHFGPDAGGLLSVDRYVAYKVVAESGRFKLSFCWAHVRRDFVRLGKSYPQHAEWGQQWVETIAQLYRLNALRREALQRHDDAAYAKAHKELCSLVQVMANIRDDELSNDDLPEEKAKVLRRLQDHWDGLTLFLESPWIPMDNNEAERLLRNPVVGRKNYYGSGAIWSGKLAATLFSIFQTLQLWDVNPRQWLTSYLKACAACGGRPPPDIDRFLPWNMGGEARGSVDLTADEAA